MLYNQDINQSHEEEIKECDSVHNFKKDYRESRMVPGGGHGGISGGMSAGASDTFIVDESTMDMGDESRIESDRQRLNGIRGNGDYSIDKSSGMAHDCCDNMS